MWWGSFGICCEICWQWSLWSIQWSAVKFLVKCSEVFVYNFTIFCPKNRLKSTLLPLHLTSSYQQQGSIRKPHYYYLLTLVATEDDALDHVAHRTDMKAVKKFKNIVFDVYIWVNLKRIYKSTIKGLNIYFESNCLSPFFIFLNWNII